MKRYFCILILILGVTFSVIAQTEINSIFTVEEYVLENGLTVYLNEDHNQPMVYGAVVVKCGSSQDPPESTGMAHYLEHLLFKGTDEIGTTDYKREKVFLDSIRDLYEVLIKTIDKKQREQIHKQINSVSRRADEFVIIDDLDNILEKIGSVDINAYTTEDCTVFHNVFPGSSINKWLQIYSHRFINPVFRSFQSELEVVYEEKNMYSDDPYEMVFNDFHQHFYRNHPYGQQTVIGKAEHLRNPSVSALENHYKKYYVPSNMALILSGDFSAIQVKETIETTFGKWENRPQVKKKEWKEKDFIGRELVKSRKSKLREGIIAFRTVPLGHEDEAALNLIQLMLSNERLTGRLDSIYMSDNVAMIEIYNEQFSDYGGMMFLFSPGVLREKFKATESIILRELDSICEGNFSIEMLNSAKQQFIMSFQSQIETVNEYNYEIDDYTGRPEIITDAFISGRSWNDVLKTQSKVNAITRENIMEVARRYFNGNYLSYHAKRGFHKNPSMEKLPIEPILNKNQNKVSSFAKKLNEIPDIETASEFPGFKDVVYRKDLQKNLHFNHTKNPVNDIFMLTIRFGEGIYNYPALSFLAEYLKISGTEEFPYSKFASELSKFGGYITIDAAYDHFDIIIKGTDSTFSKSLLMLNSLLSEPFISSDVVYSAAERISNDYLAESYDPSTLADVILSYAIYGEESAFLKRPSWKQLKNFPEDSIALLLYELRSRETFVHYNGTLSPEQVEKAISESIEFPKEISNGDYPHDPEAIVYNENHLFFINTKKTSQSQIYLYVEGLPVSKRDIAVAKAFNLYFNQLVYNEIRDYRAMAYQADAYFSYPYSRENKGYVLAFMSTQSDKTFDALNALVNIFENMPEYPEQFTEIRNLLLRSLELEKPYFRNLSDWIETTQFMGYEDDPRQEWKDIYEELTFQDLVSFYQNNIKEKPIVFAVAGNKKELDLTRLFESAENVTVVKKENVIND